MSEEFNEVVEEEVVEDTETLEETPAEEVEDVEETADSEEGQEEIDYASKFLETFKVTYDGNEVGYESVEDLIADAQKGKNYQRVLEQRDSYKNNPAYKYIDDYMKSAGYDDPNKFIQDIKVNSKVSELTAKGMSEEDAKSLAEELVSKESVQVDTKSKEIQDFVDWHKAKVNDGVFGDELAPENIPQSVLEAYEQGQSLKEAYMDYVLKDIKVKTEQETLKKITTNKKKSAGKLAESKPNNTNDMTKAQIDTLLNGMSKTEQSKWLDTNWSAVEKAGYFK